MCIAYHEKEKNHQSGDVSGVKVNEKDDMCLVKSFKLYPKKLNPGCVFFFSDP